MRVVVALVALVGGIGATACGMDYEEFADEHRDATCGYYVRCGTFATVGDCRTYFDRFETPSASLEAAIDADKVRFNSDTAEDCLDAIDDLACNYADQDPDALAVCDFVFSGTVRIGGACAFDTECETERCVVPDCNEACCIGTCTEPRAYPGLDEPCSTVCADDLYCGFDQICHAPAGPGEECNSYVVCASLLYCSSTSGTCVPLPGRGEPCDGACNSEGLVCNSAALCADAAVAGDTCTTSNDCSDYYVCNPDTEKCELAPAPAGGLPNGQPCTFNTECASRYCDALCVDAPICF